MTACATTVDGTFESVGRSGGAVRCPDADYPVRSTDAIVPQALVERYHLRGGETVVGRCKTDRRRRGGPPELEEITLIEGAPPAEHVERPRFQSLTAIEPKQRIRFETANGPISMRIIDLMTPIGFGQRGLVVAPPRTGKTMLLQQMAHAVAVNHPDAYMVVLLVDERPEEVTDMRRTVHGQVIASSNDHDIASHVRIARLVIQKAKRLVECGRDVVLLLDSLTRLGRAFNAHIRGAGRIMSGGLDILALTEPKAIFGAARNAEEGGSLTIIASALIETGSRMDEVIFNEFKGTGNMEIVLSRELANMRIWPAIKLNESGTRKEELLLDAASLNVAHQIRRTLVNRGPVRAMEPLVAAMTKFPTNAEFVAAFTQRPML
ncbi:MAG: transcription termination factor Rho [Phycisphaerae bacterium]